MRIKDGIYVIVGLLLAAVALMIMYSKVITKKMKDMEAAMNDVNTDTTQTKLAVGYLIQEKQEAEVVNSAPRTPIGFKPNGLTEA